LLPAGAAASPQSVAAASLSFLNTQLASYVGTLGPYRNGTWADREDRTCWACDNGGPATAAATLYELTGKRRPQLLREAEQTIDTAISTRQNHNGSFTGPGPPSSPAFQTMFFGDEFGMVYHELAADLGPSRRRRWQASLAAAADYLIKTGNVTWYANGNINLGNVEFFYLVWRATGNARYEQAYHDAWTFMIHPDHRRFPGTGLIITKHPRGADGSNGSGYLTETGVGGTGFDPDYTSFQLDIASRLYLVSRDPRVLWLANLLINQLLPRINSQLQLNITGGTRHPKKAHTGFVTSAYAVLGFLGGRTGLAHDALADLKDEHDWYQDPAQANSPEFRHAFGYNAATIALAAADSATARAPHR
jgi:hypothetical protein